MKKKILYNLFNRTKPQKMGDKLLILATAPDVKRFFCNEEIRRYFDGYDLAFLNKMPLISEKELHIYKPKYLIFMDEIFYKDDFDGPGKGNKRKEWVERVAEDIDWECFIVSPIFANYNIDNKYIKIIGLTPFGAKYSSITSGLYRKNLISTGFNNVVIGAVYFGITFGYKQIAIMGFSYRLGYSYMDEDGFHIEGYAHYYDENTYPSVVKNEDIFLKGESVILRMTKRNVKSQQQLCDLALYAKANDASIVNYTDGSNVDAFKYKKLMN